MIITPLILGFAALWVLVYGGGNSLAIDVVTGDADARARSYAAMNGHIMSDSHPSHAYKRAQVVSGTTVTDTTSTSGEGGGDLLPPANPDNEGGRDVVDPDSLWLVLPSEFQGMYTNYRLNYNYTGIERSDVEEVYDQLKLMSIQEVQQFAERAAEATHRPSYSTTGGMHHTDAEMAAVIKYSRDQGIDVEIDP